MTWTRRCNVLLIIRMHVGKVQVLYCTTQLPHEVPALSPHLLMVVVEPDQNASSEGQQGTLIGGVSTAPISAIGETYTRGV